METSEFNIIFDQLNDFNNIITDITDRTESEFVLIGSKLFEINSFSKTISKSFHNINELFTTNKLDLQLNEIALANKEILDATDNTISNFTNIQVTISDMRKYLDQSRENLSIYNNIKKKLNLVSVLIRIESAWLKDQGRDFLTLAESINILSETISKKIENVNNEIKSIIGYLINVNFIVEEIIKNLDATKKEISTNISHTIDNFFQDTQKKNNDLLAIDSDIKDVFASISKVITLCQVQDMTKQQLEHITHSFPKLIEQVELANGEKSSEFAMVLIEKTLKIENNQLNATRLNFVSSTNEILDYVKNIANKSRDVKYQMQKIISSEKGNDTNIIGKIIDDIVPLADKLTLNINNSHEIFQIIQDVISKVDSITKFIDEISIISSDIDLLAINSAIKAIKLGQDGASLAILSSEIQRLSEISDHETKNITEILQEITNGSVILSDMESSNKQKENFSSIETCLNNIQNQLQELGNENQIITNDVKQLYDQIFKLEQEIDNLVPAITIQNTFDSVIISVENDIEEICNEINSLGITKDYSEELNANQMLQDMIKKYTMASERNIYLSHMKGKDHAELETDINSGEIEFFGDEQSSGDGEVELFGDDDGIELFDDNIELF